jgi:hypothetical protein
MERENPPVLESDRRAASIENVEERFPDFMATDLRKIE